MNPYAERFGHVTPEQLQAALDRFGLGQLLATAPVTTGNFGQNVFLTSTTGEYVFRGNPFFDWQFPKEQAGARILHGQTDVPVPWPYLMDQSTELLGWPFAIMRRLPGWDLWDAPERDQIALATALGKMLARLQAATFDEAMDFNLAAGRFVPIPGGERTWLARRIQRTLQLSISTSDCTSAADAAWVRSLLSTSEVRPAAWQPSCLVHGDYTVNNVVAMRSPSGWEITGVFDLMNVRIGSVEADLCRQFAVHHWGNPPAGAAFLDAYFALRPPRFGYRDRIPLLLLDERLTLWEWIQRTRPDWWSTDTGFRAWTEPVLDAMLAYG